MLLNGPHSLTMAVGGGEGVHSTKPQWASQADQPENSPCVRPLQGVYSRPRICMPAANHDVTTHPAGGGCTRLAWYDQRWPAYGPTFSVVL